jgi:DNA-binding GntR family transcriptional regulator
MRSEQRGSSLNKATEGLRAAIISGQISGGTPVLEEEWAARLSMSRTPVREAIGRLVGEGLLVKKGRQAYVFQPSLVDLIEVYEVRLPLEKQAATFAAASRTDADIAVIRDNFERLEAADNSREWFDAHERFHMGIFYISRRGKLSNLIENLRMQSEPYVRLAVHADPEFRAASIRDHREMVEALELGDADFIERITDRHLNTTCDELRRLLDLTTSMGWAGTWAFGLSAQPEKTQVGDASAALRAYGEGG